MTLEIGELLDKARDCLVRARITLAAGACQGFAAIMLERLQPNPGPQSVKNEDSEASKDKVQEKHGLDLLTICWI